MQIPELLAQRKFVSAACHAHSNAHKPPKTVAAVQVFFQQSATPINAHKPPKTVAPIVFMLE